MPFHEFPPAPPHPGVELAAFTEPYRGEAVNGDGLFVETGRADGALMLLMVDITHHGPSTIPTMLAIRDALGEAGTEGLEPSALLDLLHGRVAAEWDRTNNLACALAVKVGPPDEEVVVSNAAQPSPWLRLPGAAWLEWSWPGGPLLGLPFAGVDFPEASALLPAGASLLAFTDGVTEAGAKSGVGLFQRGPLAAFLGGLPDGAAPAEVVARLEAALRAYVGAAWPDDDTTAFCLRRP